MPLTGNDICSFFDQRLLVGAITGDDRYRYQKPAPDVFMGFTSLLRYKKFDMNFNGRINLGNYIAFLLLLL